jgi:hypothetical protein
MDAINDLTIVVEVRRTSGNEKVVEDRIELPYSIWFGEGFM